MNYIESNANIHILKQKLRGVFQNSKFCGICIDDGEKFWEIDTEFDITVEQRTHKILLKDIINYILNYEGYERLASCYICNNCTEKSIQSYLFIFNAKIVSKLLSNCVSELYSKTVDINDQIKEMDGNENNNILIVLDQESNIHHHCTDIYAKETLKPIINEDRHATIINKNLNGNKKQYGHKLQEKKKEVLETNSPFLTEFFPLSEAEDVHLTEKPTRLNKKIENGCSYVENSESHDSTFSESIISSQISNKKNNENGIEIIFFDDDIDSNMPEYLSTLEDNKNDVNFSSSPTRNRLVKPSPTFKYRNCKAVLPSYKRWKGHEKVCQKTQFSKDIFQCKICTESFTSQRTLNRHYKTHSRVQCKVCQLIVLTKDLLGHMKINHEDYIHFCKFCKYFTFDSILLKVHMKKSHSGSKCTLCNKKVKETDLKLHKCRFSCLECIENVCIHYKYLVSYRDQILNNVTKVKCVDCDYTCLRREALLIHANREHLDHHPFTCEHCSQQFYSRTRLRQHINNFHRERHLCKYCDQEFSTKFTLNNHIESCKNVERNQKCNQCTSSFVTLVELANHVKLRHDEDSFNCNLCKRQFLSNIKLQEHMFRVHSGLQMKKKKSILDCPICKVKQNNKKELLEHVKIHQNSRFPCNDCKADFNSLKTLHSHMRIHYDDVIQCVECKKVVTTTFFPHHMVYCKSGREDNVVYTCETCGKICYSTLQLKLHLKTHMAKTPCPICQKPTKPGYMKIHINNMHSKPKKLRKNKIAKINPKLTCDWCQLIATRYGELETHVNKFHLKIKPYQCSHCDRSFFSNERLKDHLNIHTTTRTCYCNICNKKLKNKACLKLHIRRHTGYTPYACEICGERFRTSSMMNTHKIKKHSEKSVTCPLCNSMFYLTRDMRSHFKKVHWKQKGKTFDPRDVKELNPKFYHLFEDGRLPKIEGEDLYRALQ